MKSLLTALFFLFCLQQTYGQKRQIDSLDNLINIAKTDTDKVNLLIDKIKLEKHISLDSAISLGKRALVTAEKAGYYHGEIAIRRSLNTDYSLKGDFTNAKKELDYLLKFIKPDDSISLARVYGDLGMMYGIQSKYDSSIAYYKASTGILLRYGDSSLLPVNYEDIAIGYQQKGNYPQALSYYQLALKMEEARKDEPSLAHTYINIAITYFNTNDLTRAETYFLNAAKIAKDIGLTRVMIYANANLSSLYFIQEKWQKAYEYGIKAATLGKLYGEPGIQATSLARAAQALAELKKFDKAIVMARLSIRIADSSKQPINRFATNYAMGDILKMQGKFSEALSYLKKCLLFVDKDDLYERENVKFYKALSLCYEKTQRYADALKAFKQSALIDDSVRSKDNIRKTTELTMNYEFNKKQQKIKAEQIARERISGIRQKALIGGLLLFLILAIVSFRAYRNKQHANRLLNTKNEEINQTLIKLESTQKQLIQSEKLASLGELTAGIAHEIQNPLNFVNNFSEVSGELLDEMKTEFESGNQEEGMMIVDDLKQNLEKIRHHGKRAQAIVTGMLEHSRVSTGQKPPTDLNALANEYLRMSYHSVQAKNKPLAGGEAPFPVTMKTDFDDSVGKINIVPQEIGRVLLNLYNNAFYALSAKAITTADQSYTPTISVSTKKTGDAIEIKVKDNGNGIPGKVLGKIFQPFFTTKPTGEGTGLGLSLSYDIVKALGGEIQVNTKEGEGTEFIIQLPVKTI